MDVVPFVGYLRFGGFARTASLFVCSALCAGLALSYRWLKLGVGFGRSACGGFVLSLRPFDIFVGFRRHPASQNALPGARTRKWEYARKEMRCDEWEGGSQAMEGDGIGGEWRGRNSLTDWVDCAWVPP